MMAEIGCYDSWGGSEYPHRAGDVDGAARVTSHGRRSKGHDARCDLVGAQEASTPVTHGEGAGKSPESGGRQYAVHGLVRHRWERWG